MKAVYEQFFFMKYSGGWSFTEMYNLPIGLRNWFFERLVKQIKDEAEQIKKGSSGNSQELSRFNQPTPPPNLK